MPRERGRILGRTDEINAHDQLGLALARALDLGGGVRSLVLLGNGTSSRGRSAGRVSLLATEPGGATAGRGSSHRRRPLAHGVHVRGVADGGARVDGRRASGHLARRGAVEGSGVRAGAVDRRAGRALRVVGRVAGRPVAWARVVHGETGRRRRGAEGRRRAGVRDLLVLRYLTWRRGAGGRDPLGGLDACG